MAERQIELNSSALVPARGYGFFGSPITTHNENKEIELVTESAENPVHCISPESSFTESTSPASSSPESNDGLLNVSEPSASIARRLSFDVEEGRNGELQVEETPFFIASRINRGYELRLMSELPVNKEEFKKTSIITPTGLYQLNQDVNEFRCVLNIAQLNSIGITDLLTRAEHVSDPNGHLMYDYLSSIEQLNQLERLVRSYGGFTVTGFLINEELCLRAWGFMLCNYNYPPLPNAFSRKMLHFINTDLMHDIRVSMRSTVHVSVIYGFIIEVYFQYTQQSLATAYNFTITHTIPLLALFGSIGLGNLALLQSGCSERELNLARVNRSSLILMTMIGFAENWNNYGPIALFALSKLITLSKGDIEYSILYGFFPVLTLAFLKSWHSSGQSTRQFINIANHTEINILINAFCSSLTEGSFWSLGLKYPINSLVFFYKNMNNSQTLERFNRYIEAVRFAVCLMAFIVHLPRYPHAPISCQIYGRYASNLINGIGGALLDNGALSLMLGMIAYLSCGPNLSPSQTLAVTLYFGSQVALITGVLMVTLPTTLDLPEYSTEPRPDKPTLINRISRGTQGVIEQGGAVINACAGSMTRSLNVSVELQRWTPRVWSSSNKTELLNKNMLHTTQSPLNELKP